MTGPGDPSDAHDSPGGLGVGRQGLMQYWPKMGQYTRLMPGNIVEEARPFRPAEGTQATVTSRHMAEGGMNVITARSPVSSGLDSHWCCS
jgi:hypothetical protein